MVPRQSSTVPSAVPMGTPSAVDEVRPRTTREMAPARRLGGAMAAAVAPALGVNRAAPAAASTRVASTQP